jgi:hypothetical protein
MQAIQCPICRSHSEVHADTQTFFYKCPKCGAFEIIDEAYSWLEKYPLSPQAVANLSGFLRDTPDFKITRKNVEQLAKMRTPPLSDRAERLLMFLSREFPSVGFEIELVFDQAGDFILEGDQSSPTVQSRLLIETRSADVAEIRYLVDSYLCGTLGYLKPLGTYRYLITPTGWKWIERGTPNKESHHAFVAMSFDSELSPLYSNAIRPGIEAAGYNPLRIDQHEHVNRIDDEILAGLRRSKFCVADFTKQKAGVYFEAGFALGLGLTVVWTCSEDDLQRVHFDTRQYNMLTWKATDFDDFKTRLTARIVAVLGTGPLEQPPGLLEEILSNLSRDRLGSRFGDIAQRLVEPEKDKKDKNARAS